MPNLPCPQCGDQSLYSTYANGTTETGYCTRCAFESLVQTKKRDPRPIIHIEKPKPKQQRIKRNR